VADPRRIDCPVEAEVIAAARAGRWPGPADAELRTHVESCASCREIAEISALLAAEWDTAQAEAQPPSADLVWWRAQRRARLEAARAAEAPVRTARLVAAICTVLLVGGLGWWLLGPLGQLVSGLLAHASAPADVLRPGAPPLLRRTALLALVAAVVFVPIALYLAFVDE